MFYLLVGFIVWLAATKKLSDWAALLVTPKQTEQTQQTETTPQSSGQDVNTDNNFYP